MSLQVRWAAGPRALEADLLDSLAELCSEAAADPACLAAPLRLVVPSQALQGHLAAALLERVGGAVLGLRIQTLESAALELLGRLGELSVDPLLCGVAVRALARREPALAQALDSLDDGYAVVSAAVDDLLDAGFRPEHESPLCEALAGAVTGRAFERGAAVFRVAAAVGEEICAGRLGHRSATLSRAAELLLDGQFDALPSRACWIHGFADATGVQLDFLEALASRHSCTLWLDWPEARAWRFGEGLRARLAGAASLPGERRQQATLEKWLHPDHEGEALAAASWARARLNEGLPAERVAIVARDLPRHRLALRRQLDRLAVPFSGAEERGGAEPLARRLEASFALAERAGALPTERWLEAMSGCGGSERADLRDACLRLGAESLAEVAALADAAVGRGVRLDAPTGIEVGSEAEPKVRKRRVSRDALIRLRAQARDVLARLEGWPAEASLTGWVAQFDALGHALGWEPEGPERSSLAEAFSDPEGRGAWPIPRGDWPRLLRRVMDGVGWAALGGRGGGVQVLSVMEARGRGFEALRVVGLERGVFPRRIGDDPLFPDAVRFELRAVLGDLPIKGEGHEEERFLFAQLLAAAPQVSLSRARHDARGRPTQASPLFESLALSEQEGVAGYTPRLGNAADLEASLVAARAAAGMAAADCAAPARARLATLAELDGQKLELGPYLGVIGSARAAADPRHARPSVSLLEGIARCPWKAFLEKLLRLSPSVDARAPLPLGADTRLLGNVVHAALEDLCDPASTDSPWPDAAPLSWLEASAAGKLRDEGVGMPGYALVLAQRAAPYVEVARRLDLADPWTIRGVEVKGQGMGAAERIRFRADRLDERDAELRYTDWKTGKRKPEALTPAGQEKEMVQLLGWGELLQGHVYASAGALGRYVYLNPEASCDDEQREVAAGCHGPQQQAFEVAVHRLFAALDRGALPPRLSKPEEDSEPHPCTGCEVKQACLRGDSGARARLVGWSLIEGERAELEAAGHGVWKMGKSK